jgi:hypothetical protein
VIVPQLEHNSRSCCTTRWSCSSSSTIPHGHTREGHRSFGRERSAWHAVAPVDALRSMGAPTLSNQALVVIDHWL